MKNRSFSTFRFIHFLLAGSIILLSSQIKAQVSCDSIVIASVQYSGLDENVIEVIAYTETNDCISGPTFILYDMNGDTIATESIGFFCLGIGSPQSHGLAVLPGATVLSGPQDVTLELFSGGAQDPVCSWDLTIDLCPADSCVQAQIYMIDRHSQLSGVDAYWVVTNEAGTFSEGGIFNFDGVSNIDYDTLCLPPGSYTIWMSPFSNIDVSDSITLGVKSLWQLDPGVNTITLNDSTVMDLQFPWYGVCADIDNTISEEVKPTLLLSVIGDMLAIRNNKGNPLGALELLTIDGRVARSLDQQTDRVDIPIHDLTSGVYLVRSISKESVATTSRIFIP